MQVDPMTQLWISLINQFNGACRKSGSHTEHKENPHLKLTPKFNIKKRQKREGDKIDEDWKFIATHMLRWCWNNHLLNLSKFKSHQLLASRGKPKKFIELWCLFWFYFLIDSSSQSLSETFFIEIFQWVFIHKQIWLLNLFIFSFPMCGLVYIFVSYF